MSVAWSRVTTAEVRGVAALSKLSRSHVLTWWMSGLGGSEQPGGWREQVPAWAGEGWEWGESERGFGQVRVEASKRRRRDDGGGPGWTRRTGRD